MGRKVQSQSGSNKNKMSSKQKQAAKEEKELLDTVDSLLRLTTLPIHNSVAKSLECQKQINAYLDRIKALEDKIFKRQNKVRFNFIKTFSI